MDLIGSSIIGIAVGLVVAIALRMQKQKNTPESPLFILSKKV
jgi:hypothetical protein